MMASMAAERMKMTMRPASTAHTLFHFLGCDSVPFISSSVVFLRSTNVTVASASRKSTRLDFQVMHPRLAETMTFVEEKRRELLNSFEGVPGDRLCRRAAPDGWSVAEILEHLRMVEAWVARLIIKRVGQARDAGVGEDKGSS